MSTMTNLVNVDWPQDTSASQSILQQIPHEVSKLMPSRALLTTVQNWLFHIR